MTQASEIPTILLQKIKIIILYEYMCCYNDFSNQLKNFCDQIQNSNQIYEKIALKQYIVYLLKILIAIGNKQYNLKDYHQSNLSSIQIHYYLEDFTQHCIFIQSTRVQRQRY
eukprot:EC097224.1.p2 GENE.EC097224.1~~EC097224.1.p2  ORF type:complete len:112 (-),score=3.27 EC097224.1:112-447(-)